jgi:hypothetical protein
LNVVLLVKNINRNNAIYLILIITSRFLYHFKTNHVNISNVWITTIIETPYNFPIFFMVDDASNEQNNDE